MDFHRMFVSPLEQYRPLLHGRWHGVGYESDAQRIW